MMLRCSIVLVVARAVFGVVRGSSAGRRESWNEERHERLDILLPQLLHPAHRSSRREASTKRFSVCVSKLLASTRDSRHAEAAAATIEFALG